MSHAVGNPVIFEVCEEPVKVAGSRGEGGGEGEGEGEGDVRGRRERET